MSMQMILFNKPLKTKDSSFRLSQPRKIRKSVLLHTIEYDKMIFIFNQALYYEFIFLCFTLFTSNSRLDN